MGVHGLHTFLEENKGKVDVQSLNALAEAARKTATEAKAKPNAQPLLLLVDGLSVLMSLAQAVPDRTHGPAFSSTEETRSALLSALLSDYATLHQQWSAFIGALTAAGARMIFYFDMSSGDEDERAKLPARRDRQRQYIRKLVNCENWLRGDTATPTAGATDAAKQASEDEWRQALDTMPQMIVWQMEQSCRTLGCETVLCVGEADLQLSVDARHPGTFAVLARDSDFSLMNGIQYIPYDSVDIDYKSGEVKCRLYNTKVTAGLLGLPESRLPEFAFLAGNDYSRALLESSGLVHKLSHRDGGAVGKATAFLKDVERRVAAGTADKNEKEEKEKVAAAEAAAKATAAPAKGAAAKKGAKVAATPAAAAASTPAVATTAPAKAGVVAPATATPAASVAVEDKKDETPKQFGIEQLYECTKYFDSNKQLLRALDISRKLYTGESLAELLPPPAHLAEPALKAIISRLQSSRLPRITLSLSHLALRVQPVPIESSKPSRHQPLTHTQVVQPAEAAIVLLAGRRDARLVLRKERDSSEALVSAHDACHQWEVRLHKELSPAWTKSGQSAGAVPRWAVAHNQPIVAANLPLAYTPLMEEATKLSLWSLALHSYPVLQAAAFGAADALLPATATPAALRVPIVCWRSLLAAHVEARRLLPEYLVDVFLFTSALLASQTTMASTTPPAVSAAVPLLKANTWVPAGMPTPTNKRQIAAGVTMDFLTVLAQISHALTTSRELAAMLDIDTSAATGALPFVGPDQLIHPRVSWTLLHHLLSNKLSAVTLTTPVAAPVKEVEKKGSKNKKGSKAAPKEEEKKIEVDGVALATLATVLSLPAAQVVAAHANFLAAKAAVVAPFGGVWPEVELLSKEEEEEEERRVKSLGAAAAGGKATKKDKKKPVKGNVEKQKNVSSFAALMDDDDEDEQSDDEPPSEEEPEDEEEAADDDDEPKATKKSVVAPVKVEVKASEPVKPAAPLVSLSNQNWADIQDEEEEAEAKEDGDDMPAAEEDGWTVAGKGSKAAKGIKVPCKWGSRCREREKCKDYHSAEEMAAWGTAPKNKPRRTGPRPAGDKPAAATGTTGAATPAPQVSSSRGSASARGVTGRAPTYRKK